MWKSMKTNGTKCGVQHISFRRFWCFCICEAWSIQIFFGWLFYAQRAECSNTDKIPIQVCVCVFVMSDARLKSKITQPHVTRTSISCVKVKWEKKCLINCCMTPAKSTTDRNRYDKATEIAILFRIWFFPLSFRFLFTISFHSFA